MGEGRGEGREELGLGGGWGVAPPLPEAKKNITFLPRLEKTKPRIRKRRIREEARRIRQRLIAAGPEPVAVEEVGKEK